MPCGAQVQRERDELQARFEAAVLAVQQRSSLKASFWRPRLAPLAPSQAPALPGRHALGAAPAMLAMPGWLALPPCACACPLLLCLGRGQSSGGWR